MYRPPIAPGAQIVLRDAVWRVTHVDRSSTGLQAWRVVGLSEIVRGQDALFLEEHEGAVQVLDPAQTTLVHDPSPQHRAARLAIEAALREVPPTDDRIAIGHRGAFDPLPYQLEPARMALGQLRPRILIADAVGLGKTLEAGVLLAELIRRGRARRILVCTVKSVLTQFQRELWARFAIPLTRLDSAGLQRLRAALPGHHNPFMAVDRVIVSIDTLKQRGGPLSHHLAAATWDVVIIDEAHNVAERGGLASQRHALARVLASRTDALILLSATPHDGRPKSFASLMNLLDPTAIPNPERYDASDIRGLYTRRFRHTIRAQLGDQLPLANIKAAPYAPTPAEERAFKAISALHTPKIDRGHHSPTQLLRIAVEKGFFSSPAAALQTLDTRRKSLLPRQEQLADELAQVDALIALLRSLDPLSTSRLAALRQLLDGWRWTGRDPKDRLVLFTERVETAKALQARLPAALGLPESAVALLHGGLTDVEQQEIVETFGQAQRPVRLLVCSDVASEGINLHHLSHRLIHWDLPWSLMVFQQRNGRIDRYGQEHQPLIRYLLAEPTDPKSGGDLRVIAALCAKEASAHENIADPCALQGLYTVEAQEEKTAQALLSFAQAAPQTSAQIDEALGFDELDPLEALILAGQEPTPAAADTTPTPSLYSSDRAWLIDGVRHLQDNGLTTHITGDANSPLVELQAPDDLVRRLRRLHREALPADGVLSLTDDPRRMKAELKRCRDEEDAVLAVQYLWPLHPVLGWLGDRVRNLHGRHAAPVLLLDRLDPHEAFILVSALLPNRRSQPVLHRWRAARFLQGRLVGLVELPALLDRLQLHSRPIPNLGPPQLDRLQPLVAPAVEAVRDSILPERDALAQALQARHAEATQRLAQLQTRRIQALEQALANKARPTARDREALDAARRAAQDEFERHRQWAHDTLTIERNPALTVTAALAGRAARQES